MTAVGVSHTHKVARPQVSARSGRKRAEPPVACTTSTAVRELIVFPTLELRAIADADARDIAAALLATDKATCDTHLRRIAARLPLRRANAEVAAGKADECAGKLEEAEELRDWDLLAPLTSFPGREIAAQIRPLLDCIADPFRLGEIPAAQAKLGGYFEQLGAAILESKVTYHLRTRQRKTLAAEFERWSAFGAQVSA